MRKDAEVWYQNTFRLIELFFATILLGIILLLLVLETSDRYKAGYYGVITMMASFGGYFLFEQITNRIALKKDITLKQ